MQQMPSGARVAVPSVAGTGRRDALAHEHTKGLRLLGG